MRSMKDSRQRGGIWLVIDLLLLLLALGAGFIYYQTAQEENYLSEQEYTKQIQTLDQQYQELLDKRERLELNRPELEKQAAEMVAAAEEKLTAAQETCEVSNNGLEEVQTELEEMEAKAAEDAQMVQKLSDLRAEYGSVVRQLEDEILEGKSDYRICYLTFDDGPTYYTADFLKKLDKYGAYATFFTIGNLDEEMRADLMRQQMLGGHIIQNHTYTHGFDTGLYDSVESFIKEVTRQDDFVYQATGMHTDVVRFPAGSYYANYRSDTIAELEKQGYGWIDWCGNAYDSGSNLPSAQSTVNNVLWQARQEKIYVVLMHDWNANTLAALDSIIPTLQSENYVFLPLFKDSSTVGTAYPRWD